MAGGGHAMAAGLTIRPRDVPELRAFLSARLAKETAQALAEDALELDAVVTARRADRALLDAFAPHEPVRPRQP